MTPPPTLYRMCPRCRGETPWEQTACQWCGLSASVTNQPARYDLPETGRVEIDSVYFYRAAFGRVYGRREEGFAGELIVSLVPEPTNPKDRNAVQLMVDGTTVGHLPKDIARNWVEYLAAQETCGLRAYAQADFWYRWAGGYDDPTVYLRVHIADSPSEAAEVEARRSERARASAERVRVREAKKASTAHRRAQSLAKAAQEAERRAAGLCLDCGQPLVNTGRVRCPECLAQRAGRA